MKRVNLKNINVLIILFIILLIFIIIFNNHKLHIVNVDIKKQMEAGTKIHIEVYDNSKTDIKTVLIITNPIGIDEISVGNNKIKCGGKTSVGIDFDKSMNDNAFVSVKDNNGDTKVENVNIKQSDIDNKIGIIDNTEQNDINKNVTLSFNNMLNNDGVKKYYKIGENNKWEEYSDKNLEFNAYYINLHKYQNQDNTITIYGKIEDAIGNVVINSKKCLLNSSAVAMEIIPNIPVTTSNVSTFPNLLIRNECQEPIKGIIVQFTSSIVAGDKIELNANSDFEPINGTSYIYVKTEGKTAEEIQEYLRANLKVTTYNSVQVKFSIGTMVYTSIIPYFAENGHYYEYVASPGITWANAKIAAENRTYLGVNRIFSNYN